ncbi:acetyl-CoA synthetase-like protein [Leucosporidium creatinivorum]|uniref:Acetyl-CoA synthetase-like protein n=1 Tax=Leucosporidium creatinivorum TaxID=106004 RepID=A0A1Y2FWT2_9BASI|nr:acetyl-CoA synthetase-like protein [Leucosporidium creatinivorum]
MTVVNNLQSVTELLQSRARTHPDTFVLGCPDRNLKITNYTFGELEAATNCAAHHYASLIPPRAAGDSNSKLTVALLASSGYDYLITELALSRIGVAVLFVSINNTPAAVAHLIKATQSSHLIIGPAYEQIGAETLALGQNEGVKLVQLAEPSVHDSKAQALVKPYPPALSPAEESKLIAFIVHSSGSTGFPKPIYINHAATIFNIANNFGLRGLTTLPLYHNHGHSCMYRALFSLKPLWLFPSSELPLTTGNVLNILQQPGVKEQVQALFGVPYLYKLLAEEDNGIDFLKTMELCLYGGSAMPTELGHRLVEAGVKLVGHYGATEVGQLMTSFRAYEEDKDWDFNRVSDQLRPFIMFEDQGHGTYEVVVKDGWRGKSVSNRPNGDYALSDLFIKHPTIENRWKFVGRIDDTLVLINGEKVNPVPIELTLRGESPYIADAVIFGGERAQIGALLVLSEAAPSSATREEILSLIRPTLALANSASPSHAQLSDELLLILPAGTPIPKADKGSFIRRKVYAEFKDKIEGVYSALEGDDTAEADKKDVGSVEEMETALFELVKSVAGGDEGLTKDTDLFSYGLDSLAAGRIRNALQRDFRLGGKKLSTNFVFEQPTIAQAASFLVAFASGKTITKLSEVEQMTAMVSKYGALIPTRTKPSGPPSLATVVLTGATGSLGVQLLAQLLADSSVKKIYALVRAKDDADAASRVGASLKERVLSGIEDPRVVPLAADLAKEQLGLTSSRYDEIVSSATVVLHNAWAVNFNLGLASFEPHVKGAMNLINLCFASPYGAAYYFASSVSAVAAWRGPGDVPEAVTEHPSYAQGMGYARSKWVTEALCKIVSETTPVRAVVLRIGQMVGSTVNGRWNESEAISLQLRTGDVLGALPDLKETPSWLPVNFAAKTILDLAVAPAPSQPTSQAWHVLQPKLVPFSSVLDSLAACGIKFDRVSPSEWVERLRTGPQDPTVNPTIKLLEFFESKYGAAVTSSNTAPKRYQLSTEKTLEASKSLREAPVVDSALMAKYVETWRQTGFFARP